MSGIDSRLSTHPFWALALAAALPVLSVTSAGCGGDTMMGTSPDMTQSPPQDVTRLNHIVVIYLENHSFDNLYGEFIGAEGLAAAQNAGQQTDTSGKVYDKLPQPIDTNKTPAVPDPRFPTDLANAPFNIEKYVPANQQIPDLVHRFYQEQAQIDGGKMDRFAAVSDARGLAMGYYHTAGLPLAQIAGDYTLCDHFFHAAFGGSFLNHIWLVAAASPTFPNAPAAIVAKLDEQGNLVKDGAVSPEGFAINTAFTVNTPHPATVPMERLVPQQTLKTIGDLLSDKGVSWAWYAGGWNDAVAGKADVNFQFHHQPFAYFATYKDGTQAKADHLKDEGDFMTALSSGKLPAVSFIKPIGANNEHPGYADVVTGEKHVMDLIGAIKGVASWNDTAIIITYDENGGFWDHASPPKRDKWGPGSRVPTLIVSPYAKKKYIDHTPYDTLSILAFIEKRFQLGNLGGPDATAADLSPAFDFTQNP